MPQPGPSSFSDDDERRRRLEALHGLAQSQPPSTSAPAAPSAADKPAAGPRQVTPVGRAAQAPSGRKRPQRPWWLIVGSVVLVIAVVVGVIVHQLTSAPHRHIVKSPPPSAALTVTPAVQGLECLKDAAWSPDGSEIAALGYQDQCPDDLPSSYNYEPAVLNIYSSTSGHVLKNILPDATEEALPGAPRPDNTEQSELGAGNITETVLDYVRVLWSPDGKQLALPFYISRWSGRTQLPGYSGLVLVNADGTHARAALYKETRRQYGGLRWDTTSLAPLALPYQSRYGGLDSVAPGTTYTWSASGQLVPSGSLANASTPPTASIGTPDGGASFTVWQPGSIQYINQASVNNQAVTVSPGVYIWTTAFLAWSPDGRYLITPVSLLALPHPAGQPRPTDAGLKSFGLEEAPSLASPDPAFQQLLTSLAGDTSSEDEPQVDLAWSPDGRILAAVPELRVGVTGTAPSPNANGSPVTFYDTATGSLVETLVTLSNSQASPIVGSISFLRWSADSSHLFVFSDHLDTITIWGPTRLPRGA